MASLRDSPKLPGHINIRGGNIMGIHCPVCRQPFALSSLRKRFQCSNCGNPLSAHLGPPLLTFLFMFVVINGFIVLSWWTLTLPDPGTPTGADAAGDWGEFPTILIILSFFISSILFVWIFKTITHVSLDRNALPDGLPRHLPSERHYRAEKSSAE